MSKRSSMIMVAVTAGALALSTAAVIGAFVVVDQRAAQVLRDEPRIVPAEKKGASPAHSSRMTVARKGNRATKPRSAASTETQTVGSGTSPDAADPRPAFQQRNAGEITQAPATGLDSEQKRRTEARHSRKRHGWRLGRSAGELHRGGVGPRQGSEQGAQSAFFFPFR